MGPWTSHFSFPGLLYEEVGLRDIHVHISSHLLWLIMELKPWGIKPFVPVKTYNQSLSPIPDVSGSCGASDLSLWLSTRCTDRENHPYQTLSSSGSWFCLEWWFREDSMGQHPDELQRCVFTFASLSGSELCGQGWDLVYLTVHMELYLEDLEKAQKKTTLLLIGTLFIGRQWTFVSIYSVLGLVLI